MNYTGSPIPRPNCFACYTGIASHGWRSRNEGWLKRRTEIWEQGMHEIRKWYFSHISGLNSSIKRRKSWKFTPLSSAALRASYAWRRASLETGWEYGYFSSYTPMQCTAKHSRFGNINEPSAGSLGYPTLWMIDVNEDDVCVEPLVMDAVV